METEEETTYMESKRTRTVSWLLKGGEDPYQTAAAAVCDTCESGEQLSQPSECKGPEAELSGRALRSARPVPEGGNGQCRKELGKSVFPK